jgi:hypothetical protein
LVVGGWVSNPDHLGATTTTGGWFGPLEPFETPTPGPIRAASYR